jgi:predicted aspartyl protease
MKFDYTLLDGAFMRPYATIKVGSGKNTRRYKVLVDSGADINVFSASLAESLGLELQDGEAVTVRGATGKPGTFYAHPVTIEVANQSFTTTAAFADMPHLELAGLVGQQGFFDHFIVTFDADAREFELIPKS